VIGHRIGVLSTDDAAAKRGPELLDQQTRTRHLYAAGATGGGKSNFLYQLIKADILEGRTCVVLDARGDYIERILRLLASLGAAEEWAERLVILDLRDSGHCLKWNPLLEPGDPYARALGLHETIRVVAESWGTQLDETLPCCLLALTLSEVKGSLLDVLPLLENAGFRAEVLKSVSDPQVVAFFRRFDDAPDRQASWRLPITNKIAEALCSPVMRLQFGQLESLSLAELLDTGLPKIILCSLAIDKLHGAGMLAGNLFANAFQNAIMSRATRREENRRVVHLYLDEAQNLSPTVYADLIAEGRRMKCGVTLTNQNQMQLATEVRHLLRNNVYTRVFFRVGALDAADLVREIESDLPKDELKARLTRQGVGEAVLLRTGEPAVQIKTAYEPDPKVSDGDVAALRAASYAVFSRPAGVVQAELDARSRWAYGLSGWAAETAPTKRKAATISDPDYQEEGVTNEIRTGSLRGKFKRQ
jgi:hypothetical protein